MATLNDNALTTLAVVKDELGLTSSTDDDYLIRQINALSSLFEEATERMWYRDASHVEDAPSVGDSQIMVDDRLPLRSVSQIEVDGDTVDSADYSIEDADVGIIRLDDGFWKSTAVGVRRVERYVKHYELDVQVTYDGGYVTPEQAPFGASSDPRDLPVSIELAIIESVTNKYRRRGANTRITRESIGPASVTYGASGGPTSNVVGGAAVSQSFASAVERHKNRSVLR